MSVEGLMLDLGMDVDKGRKMTEFWMFTEAGNSAVAKVVECAETAELSWPVVESMLEVLSRDERYSEATDTAVRETVFGVLFP